VAQGGHRRFDGRSTAGTCGRAGCSRNRIGHALLEWQTVPAAWLHAGQQPLHLLHLGLGLGNPRQCVVDRDVGSLIGGAVLTDTLCTRCGLCCDGTLFGDVELTGPREATRLEGLGLDVDSDDADTELLSLPCRGLRGTRCSVYVHRPQCCRTFECRLLENAGRGVVTVDEALARIAEAKAQVLRVTTLLAGIEPRRGLRLPLEERVADAVAAAPRSPAGARRRAALETAMAALRRTIRTSFLE
jgi:Fe-S-cluster containining protein